MTKSIIELLEEDLECENILNCLYGFNDLDKECFKILLESDNKISASDISKKVDRDESTVHRSLARLEESDLIYKEKESLDTRGYQYIYQSKDFEEICQDMNEIVEKWNQNINNLIEEFENKYE